MENRALKTEKRSSVNIEEYVWFRMPEYTLLAESMNIEDAPTQRELVELCSKIGPIALESLRTDLSIRVANICEQANLPFAYVRTILDAYILDMLSGQGEALGSNELFDYMNSVENGIQSRLLYVDRYNTASEILSRGNGKLRQAIQLAVDGKTEEAVVHMDHVNAEVLVFASVCKQIIAREGSVEKLQGVSIERKKGSELTAGNEDSEKEQMSAMSRRNYEQVGTVVPDELQQKLYDGTYNDSDFYIVKQKVEGREHVLSFVRLDQPVGEERQVGSFNTHQDAQGVLFGQVTAYEVLAREGQQYTLVADVCVPTGLFNFYEGLGFRIVGEKSRNLGNVTLPFYDIVRPKGAFHRP